MLCCWQGLRRASYPDFKVKGLGVALDTEGHSDQKMHGVSEGLSLGCGILDSLFCSWSSFSDLPSTLPPDLVPL